MISRHWTGIAKREKVDAYIEHLQTDTFPKLKLIPGFLGAQIQKRELIDGVEFLIVTEWESIAAIKKFAGENYDVAIVPDIVKTMMKHFDKEVRHYEVSARLP